MERCEMSNTELAFVKTEYISDFPKKVGNFLTSRITISFSKRSFVIHIFCVVSYLGATYIQMLRKLVTEKGSGVNKMKRWRSAATGIDTAQHCKVKGKFVPVL
jgi:hypothetical protein